MENRLVFINDKPYELVYLGSDVKANAAVCNKCAFKDADFAFCAEKILEEDGCYPQDRQYWYYKELKDN